VWFKGFSRQKLSDVAPSAAISNSVVTLLRASVWVPSLHDQVFFLDVVPYKLGTPIAWGST
jgi:hypothetical protein